MDILEHISVERPCELCGVTYAVSARAVRDSEAMLCECCPVDSDRECPQLQYALMMDAELLDELTRVWARIENAARAHGCRAVVSLPARASRVTTSVLGSRIEAYRRAKVDALRGASSESSIEHAGHYDRDTHSPSYAVTAATAEHERDAAVALADDVLARCGVPCCERAA